MLVVPKYINYKRNVTILIVGTAIFCLLFLNIYRPFNWDFAENNRLPVVVDASFTYFIFADVIALAALGVIAVSRVLMYKWVKKGGVLTYLIYGLWITAEVLVMATIFSVASYYLTPESAIQESFGMLFVKVLLYTGFTLLLPYLIFHFYFAWDNKSKLLQQMVENQVENDTNVPLTNNETSNMSIRFNDEKGNLRLAVQEENLYYIESADNYVCIHYTHLGKPQVFMHRATMKSIEELCPSVLIRCHRSYFVNMNKVKVMRREVDGLFLNLDMEKMPIIPVSKTYYDNVVRALRSTPMEQ